MKVSVFFLTGILATAFLTTNCSNDTPGSCTYTLGTAKACADYPKDLALAEQKADCAKFGGTHKESESCSTTNKIGSCTYTISGKSIAAILYSDGGVTASTAQTACTTYLSGTFAP